MATDTWADNFITHEVKKGETIFGIAKQYGINSNTLLELNPNASLGVKKGMTLKIPVEKTKTSSIQTKYTVEDSKDVKEVETVEPKKEEPKEKEYKEEKVKDTKLDLIQEAKKSQDTPMSYCAAQGDSFHKISNATGVSEDTLIELNPFLDPNALVAGTMVRLTEDAPYYETSSSGYETTTDSPKDSEPVIVQEVIEPKTTEENITDIPVFSNPLEEEVNEDYAIENQDNDIENQGNNILILLPFMTENENQSRQTKSYVDFYRGFLLAAKGAANNAGNDIDVIVADTENSLSTISKELNENGDREVAVIIAPEDPQQLQAIIDYATPRGIYVFNAFNFSDNSYKTNPYVVQANINQQLMYSKAIDYLLEEYSDYIPVILSPDNAKEEKAPFITALRETYFKQGKDIVEIDFEESLTEEDVNAKLDPGLNYVFIPKSGSQSVFNRFAPTILALQDSEDGKDRYRIFGYPDWIAYRGEALDVLQRMNAVIYSRFLSDEKDLENKDIQKIFMQWYGQPMIEAVPSQGLLGYDVGRYLIHALQRSTLTRQLNSPLSFQGLQNSYKFIHDNNDKGYINDVLYIIQFLPGDNYKVEQL